MLHGRIGCVGCVDVRDATMAAVKPWPQDSRVDGSRRLMQPWHQVLGWVCRYGRFNNGSMVSGGWT